MTDLNHNPHCFACGAENADSIGLQLIEAGDELHGVITPGRRLEGARGLLHGGAMATIIDETLGRLTRHIGREGVTARLEVNYRAPVPLERQLICRGRLVREEGRKLFVHADVHQGDRLVADAEGLWIAVDQAHFDTARDL